MKICVIAPTVIPILGKGQQYGGIEAAMITTIEEMVKRGHEVYLFASGDSKTSATLIPTAPKALGPGRSIKRQKKYNRVAYQKAIALGPDVIWDNTIAIHAHEMGKNKSKFLFNPNFVLRKKELIETGSIPVVHTLHGPAKYHLPKLIHDLSVSGHFFVSISKDQARRYLKFIAGDQHLGTVYHAIDIRFWNIPKQEKRTYLFWLGRFCMEKGPHIALKVAHKLNMPIKFMGKKSEKHEVAYFNKFIKPYLRSKDEVLEPGANRQRLKLFQGAKATMMTNLWPEPFGMVVAESMAAGTPVVGPALGSLSELVDGTGVLIPVDDLNLDEDDIEVTNSQLEYIDKIVERMGKIDRIPAKIPRKRAEFLFSPKHNVDGYEEAFYKAIYLKALN